MSTICLDSDDCYDKQCGEVFLTVKGNIIFHCTICENKYEGFEIFADHILHIHYCQNIKQEIAEELNPAQLCKDNKVLVPRYLKNTAQPPPISEYMTRLFQDDNKSESEEIDETSTKQFTINEETPSRPPINEFISKLFEDENTEIFHVKSEPTEVEESIVIKTETKTELLDNGFTEIGRTRKVETSAKSLKRKFTKSKSDQANPYTCTTCSEIFQTETELTQHLNCHNNKKVLFACNLCGKSYSTNAQLQQHTEFCTNGQGRECSICEMGFINEEALHTHMVVHDNERIHKCQTCEATFKRKKAFEDHLAMHRNKNVFKCKYCEAKFNLKTSLQWHIKNRHLKKPVETSLRNAVNGTDLTLLNMQCNIEAMSLSAALL